MASEDQSFQVPSPCANGCGFFGNPSTDNLCSKCHKEELIANESKKRAISTKICSPSPMLYSTNPNPDDVKGSTAEKVTSLEVASARKQRCGCCNKRVGLTKGFQCRCGNTYCAVHRYPKEHECPFDFKAAGRVLIAKSNPVIRAEKLDKI